MAILARHIFMPGQQFESRTIVVEMDRGPAIGRMAGGTVRSQRTSVRIVGSVA